MWALSRLALAVILGSWSFSAREKAYSLSLRALLRWVVGGESMRDSPISQMVA